MTGPIFALGIMGLGTYLMMWAGNDAAPNPNGAAEWRSCPTWLHRLFRRDAGPVLVTAVMVEIAGLVMVVVAVLASVGALRAPWAALALYAIAGSWVLALATFIAVEFRARFRI